MDMSVKRIYEHKHRTYLVFKSTILDPDTNQVIDEFNHTPPHYNEWTLMRKYAYAVPRACLHFTYITYSHAYGSQEHLVTYYSADGIVFYKSLDMPDTPINQWEMDQKHGDATSTQIGAIFIARAKAMEQNLPTTDVQPITIRKHVYGEN